MGVLTLLTCSGGLFALFHLDKICNTFGFPLPIEVKKIWRTDLQDVVCVVSPTKHNPLLLFTYKISLISNFSESIPCIYFCLLCFSVYFCWCSLFFNGLFKLIVICSLVRWLL